MQEIFFIGIIAGLLSFFMTTLIVIMIFRRSNRVLTKKIEQLKKNQIELAENIDKISKLLEKDTKNLENKLEIIMDKINTEKVNKKPQKQTIRAIQR
ncbi:MAG: hypothetical protein QXZ13_04035 [Candidatus Diapherotrites archaeon]